jgi:choline dehydrogenase-like flavoprotein
MLGAPFSQKTTSLAQLCVFYLPGSDQPPVHGRVHSYRSLLNFKVIKEMPLPYREAIRVMKLLVSSFAILALDHEDRPSPDKYCVLHPGSSGDPDRLEITYSLSPELRGRQLDYEKTVVRYFRGLGCFAIKRVWPGYGGSLHYGGTFPMSRDDKELTVDVFGRLRETESVYIVDGSVFPYLPSKGLTFTMMANANRIAEFLVKEF